MKLPEDLARQAASLLLERHRAHLDPADRFEVTGELGRAWVEVVLAFGDPKGRARTEVTVRVTIPEGAPDPKAALDLAFDAGDAYLGQWLEEGRPQQPIDFEEARYEGRPVHVRLRRRRPALEAEAERLLREAGEDPAPTD
ncbi:MAG: hypothetical protein D6729_19235 [Deltaproteobacteria bacterium]|nr:MAG: hypothetical protein D6729_19235 [Deltaproteobacteria bacterium]